MGSPTLVELREAIAEALWWYVKQYDLPATMDALGVPEPTGGDTYINSKRVFARTRLIGQTRESLIEIARKIEVDYGSIPTSRKYLRGSASRASPASSRT